jgi:hypothetical protein|tara:strand:+ start:2289 stop:2888 length:600 start_codon:yes stop_codon:yes gene_type:complete
MAKAAPRTATDIMTTLFIDQPWIFAYLRENYDDIKSNGYVEAITRASKDDHQTAKVWAKGLTLLDSMKNLMKETMTPAMGYEELHFVLYGVPAEEPSFAPPRIITSPTHPAYDRIWQKLPEERRASVRQKWEDFVSTLPKDRVELTGVREEPIEETKVEESSIPPKYTAEVRTRGAGESKKRIVKLTPSMGLGIKSKWL